jgi:hypothetical protein
MIRDFRDENFPVIPGNPGFSSDFRGFPEWVFEKEKKIFFFLVKITPQFILSPLKCKSVNPKTLKLHLQSIKLQKSFYSSNFFSFTCAVML